MNHVHRAEELVDEKQYDEAIEEYRLHMKDLQDRQGEHPWTDPAFYRLKIGDVYLLKGDTESALNEYLLGEKEGLNKDSVSFKIREVARWLRDKGMEDKAFDLLNSHKERDPLIFNALLDEIARERAEKQFKQ